MLTEWLIQVELNPIRIPKREKKKLVVNVDADIFEFLQRSAEKSDCTVTEVVGYLLDMGIAVASDGSFDPAGTGQ